ncbi:TPA: DNA replication complex GINS family protein [Candidatus Woesearchaeota archaeon]|nr:DNA replication complex GINS family protein [Candidatus Woesearchaeota archaeon]
MGEIKITLETLYDILRNEKKREDLQKLEETFYVDIVAYMREKKALLDMKKDEDQLFAVGEKEKLQYELRSIKRILKEIYEKREKKIIDIAVNKSRTDSDIIDTSAMLREEKQFYEQLLGLFNALRNGILHQLLQAQLPDLHFSSEIGIPRPAFQYPEIKHTIQESHNEESEEPTVRNEPQPTDKKKIRFIHPLPRFVWKDLKTYGPFKQGDEIDIFPEVAQLIVRKGRAEFV